MGVIEFLKQLDFALETCLKLFFLEQVIGEYLDRYVPLVLQVIPRGTRPPSHLPLSARGHSSAQESDLLAQPLFISVCLAPERFRR